MIGGNLSIMSNLITGKYSIDVTDKILFLEEFWLESPPEAGGTSYFYRMKQNDVFSKIKGIWFRGYYTRNWIIRIFTRMLKLFSAYKFSVV